MYTYYNKVDKPHRVVFLRVLLHIMAMQLVSRTVTLNNVDVFNNDGKQII